MNQNPQSSEGRPDDDTALSDFLASLMDYTPTIPDELVEHYLAKSGFQCPDVMHALLGSIGQMMTRLVAVATQKFVAEVAVDALQHCKARQATIPKDKRDKQQKDKRLVLTMEDLSKALRESQPHAMGKHGQLSEPIPSSHYGVNLRHQEYFADSPSTGTDPATREE
ncbi:Transcription initiation factor TFIID subunit 10 Protein [Vigna angularis]|uniref:Transcription initiation factor TFIID subunit 10 Protein n=1 Tax=Phaseolus angularis TaxID=3914 RepID=A0A8T0KX43_PHAAN|nr:Transcription initiation factor TFIID subunit 10 Protein [Vigna angularis]